MMAVGRAMAALKVKKVNRGKAGSRTWGFIGIRERQISLYGFTQ
jgi:hypothetical protein